ncbi:hypothetical protein [Xenorhabdus sp. SGI240]|uniref:hypothetical protein n=1 Tax=Xenorhabdus sp. SGI240 TaxID=3158262 RepID=UPI0032B7394C
MALVHPVHTYHDHRLNYSADKFSTSKHLTHYYRLILHLAATTGISTLALLLLTVRGIKASLFADLPLKVTPQPKNNRTLTGSRMLHHTVNLTLHF